MDLDRLREELAEVDRQILALVARRQTLSSDIGAAKRQSARATRDFNQEKTVIDRARKEAESLGLSPGLSRRILLLLIESSLTVQERDRVVAQAGGSGQRALVIGGRGKMGGWFVRFLASQGYDVEVADPAGPVDGHRSVDDWTSTDLTHDIIVVAAPLGTSNTILREMAHRKPRGLVFDVGSLKSPLHDGLRALVDAGVRVTSLHPMFGPETELLSGRHIVFVDVGSPAATAAARALFDSTMAVQVDMDLEGHDRSIAYVLGLSHALNIAFFTALADSGETVPKLAEISSTTFDRQLDVAGGVAAESPSLYFEIQSLNRYGGESLAALSKAVERLRTIVKDGDQEAFVELMLEGRRYMSTRRPDSP